MAPAIPIDDVVVRACTIPTDGREQDGTLSWDSTTIVLVTLRAAGTSGIGYSYADATAATLVADQLSDLLLQCDAMNIRGTREQCLRAVRNLGRPGIAATAISAVDIALWDLKAKLLDLPLVRLLGAVRENIPVYGSGGFTNYSTDRLSRQLGDWAAQGMQSVKMKVGTDPASDPGRVAAARESIGPDTALFVDANGAYSTKQALALATRFAEQGVVWYEEPVSSDDIDGLALLRSRVPATLEVAAGEYGYSAFDFLCLLRSHSVDVLQADATRCLGITGFLDAAILAGTFHIPVSSHTAPSAHVHACCAVLPARHMEWFYDHVRIEEMLFEGFREPVSGYLSPDTARPGLGLELREKTAERFAL